MTDPMKEEYALLVELRRLKKTEAMSAIESYIKLKIGSKTKELIAAKLESVQLIQGAIRELEALLDNINSGLTK